VTAPDGGSWLSGLADARGVTVEGAGATGSKAVAQRFDPSSQRIGESPELDDVARDWQM
jgi:hypothetical protein